MEQGGRSRGFSGLEDVSPDALRPGVKIHLGEALGVAPPLKAPAKPRSPLLYDAATLLALLLMIFLLLNPSSARIWLDEFSVGVHAGIFGGPVFDLVVLCVVCNLAGKAVARLGLPPLSGMLLMGFLLRQLTCTRGITSLLNSKVRDVALGVIMSRAGLGLDLQRLWTERGITTALSTLPMFVESLTIALLSWATGALTLPWGLLLGFIIADVSPAVTVPLLMEFDEVGYGRDKGIPSILLAASGLNSVAAIVGYGTVFSILFSSGLPAWAPALLGVVEIFGLGFAFGIGIGAVLLYLWPAGTPLKRFLLLLTISILTIQLGKKVGMSGGGCLCTLSTAAWIAYKMRSQGSEGEVKEVSAFFGLVWATAGQPLLFGLLGASVSIDKLEGGHVVTGLYLVLTGLTLRALATFACVRRWTTWNAGEVAFAVITWCPKATVQAALAGVALDYIEITGEDYGSGAEYEAEMGESYDVLLDRAKLLLTTGILSILMTAPLFAVLMYHAGRKFLKLESDDVEALSGAPSVKALSDVYSDWRTDEPDALVPQFTFSEAPSTRAPSRAPSRGPSRPQSQKVRAAGTTPASGTPVGGRSRSASGNRVDPGCVSSQAGPSMRIEDCSPAGTTPTCRSRAPSGDVAARSRAASSQPLPMECAPLTRIESQEEVPEAMEGTLGASGNSSPGGEEEGDVDGGGGAQLQRTESFESCRKSFSDDI